MYSSAELAKLLGISKNTILRWEAQKLIPKANRDGRGWRLWTKEQFLEILEFKKSTENFIAKNTSKERISIIGYGNQARVWAKNLKSSGFNVKILLRKNSSTFKTVFKEGFEAEELSHGLKEGKIFCLLIPDEAHGVFFKNYNHLLNSDKLFIFAHGYSVSYLNIKTPARKALLAPKAIASVIREKFLTNKEIPTAIFAEYEKDTIKLKNLSKALGFFPLIETSFKEETISDLFSEQTLLCSSVPYFMLKTFNLLFEKGINKNLAFEECLNELYYIIQTIKTYGVYEFYKKISPIAFKGASDFIEALENNKEFNKLFKLTYKNIIDKKFDHQNFDKEAKLSKIKKLSLNFDKNLKKEDL